MKVILKDKATGTAKHWYDLNWGGCDRPGYLPVLKIGDKEGATPIQVDPRDYDVEPLGETREDPIYAVTLNTITDTRMGNEFSQDAQKVPGGWIYTNFDATSGKPLNSVFVPDPRRYGWRG